MLDFHEVLEASAFRIPQPFYFGAPSFEIGATLTMLFVGLAAIVVESTGVFFGSGEIYASSY